MPGPLPGYEPVGEAGGREAAPLRRGRLAAAGAAALLLLALGGALAALRPRPLREGGPALRGSEDLLAFQVQSLGDCPRFLQLEGCKRDNWWACNSNDGTLEWRCCCDDSLYPVPQWSPAAAPRGSSDDAGPGSLLRVKGHETLCLAMGDAGFELGGCHDDLRRSVFKLPLQGTGPVELKHRRGTCLGVSGSQDAAERGACAPGSPEQQFHLTGGTEGMLQWFHSGSKCVESQGGARTKGSRIVVADCIYYPASQGLRFLRAEAPELAEEDAREEEEEEREPETRPTLFCTSLMLWWTYELDMIRAQLEREVSIFACDRWAVYSNESVQLRGGDDPIHADVVNGSLRARIGGAYHTALNTPVFRRYWERIMRDGRAWKSDWIVKVDPDAVFMPDRLKEMLLSQWPGKGTPGYAQWLNNCHLGAHGPIEVFTKQALGVYHGQKAECEEVAREHGQEDVFLAACFAKLKIGKIDAYNLLLESAWACNERPSSAEQRPPCYDRQVSFHPFKDPESYFKCHQRAARMHWPTKLYVNSQPPSSANGHHA